MLMCWAASFGSRVYTAFVSVALHSVDVKNVEIKIKNR